MVSCALKVKISNVFSQIKSNSIYISLSARDIIRGFVIRQSFSKMVAGDKLLEICIIIELLILVS